jgi:acyl-CoA synthetase (AMP-forming)/AMP-acid ligase II
MNIAQILEAQARQSGQRPAIVERRMTVTFDELDRAAASAAADLKAAGVTAGMRALVFSPMSIGLYTTMIGLFRIGATAVFVDPSAGRARMNQCIARVRPGAFIAVPRAHWLRLSSAKIRAIPIKAAIDGAVPRAAVISVRPTSSTTAIEHCDDDTPAILTFTSGSTGQPKAAVRSHGFLIAQHEALAEALALAPGDIDLCTLPIFLLANLASGVTSVIPDADLRAPGAIDPGPVDAQIRETRPTRTVASPAFLEKLASHAARQSGPFETFRRIYTGGAPVFPKMLDALARMAPHASVVAVYGSTEAEPIAEIDRHEITSEDRAAMSGGAGLLAGRPVPSIRLRILQDRWGQAVPSLSDEELERSTLALETPGEIAVAGQHVLGGYLDGEGDEETKIRAGHRVWHRTGDAGYLDRQGRLWLLGRCGAKLVDDTGVTYPFAVECAASEIAGVVRTALVSHRGRRVLATEIEGGAPPVLTALRDRLAWARLDSVVQIPRIPVDRRHNAKVDYPALLRLLNRWHP